MYNILLVDDEPIIVSGIKFLIDWGKYDCKIISTASNGQEAIDFIEEYLPNIVICDINIPVCSGVKVLETISNKYPSIVFIMLTNHQEFTLAQQCLRLKATDYLLKTNLAPETLEASLLNAIKEYEKRNKLQKVTLVDSYLEKNKSEMISAHLSNFLTSSNADFLNESYEFFYKNNLLNSYYLIKVILDFSHIPDILNFSFLDKKRIYDCEQEILNKIIKTFFSSYFIIPSENYSFYIVLYNCPISSKELFIKLFNKLSNSSINITGTHVALLISNLGDDLKMLNKLKEQIIYMQDYYYYTNKDLIFYEEAMSHTLNTYELDIAPLLNQLSSLFIEKNLDGISNLFDELIALLENTPHCKEVGINCCIHFYRCLINIFNSFTLPDIYKDFFSTSTINTMHLSHAFSSKELILWLKNLKLNTQSFMSLIYENAHHDTIELAKNYINLHIFEKITLTDVATAINISPGYLSSIFKKQEQQSFIDYVNKAKIHKACELLREKHYLIYEVAYRLGFENAYYFSKVFKKYVGLTPKEYEKTSTSH